MSRSEVETICGPLGQNRIFPGPVWTRSKIPRVQLQLTTAKLEGTTETIQKMLGGGWVLVGVLAAAGLLRVFLP